MNDVKQRKERINAAVVALDPAGFAEHLTGWLEATAYLRARAEASAPKGDIAIPPLSKADLTAPEVRAVAEDAAFALLHRRGARHQWRSR